MSSKPLNLFTEHSRLWQANRYVYPVISRRSKGLSIGVNLNPDKVCNFDCIYCCVDRTSMPGKLDVDLAVLRAELDHMIGLAATGAIWNAPPFDQTPPAFKRLNDIAFSGDGEPTSHPRFIEACELAASAIDRAGTGDTKIVVITNASLIHQPRVRDALAYLDRHRGELWAKLDAGTPEYYKLVERTAVPFQQVLDNLLTAGRLRPIVIQSLFMQIDSQAPADVEIAAYLGRLRHLFENGCQIKNVQIYTIARSTAERYVAPLDKQQVDSIVSKVRAMNLPVEGYYGPD